MKRVAWSLTLLISFSPLFHKYIIDILQDKLSTTYNAMPLGIYRGLLAILIALAGIILVLYTRFLYSIGAYMVLLIANIISMIVLKPQIHNLPYLNIFLLAFILTDLLYSIKNIILLLLSKE